MSPDAKRPPAVEPEGAHNTSRTATVPAPAITIVFAASPGRDLHTGELDAFLDAFAIPPSHAADFTVRRDPSDGGWFVRYVPRSRPPRHRIGRRRR